MLEIGLKHHLVNKILTVVYSFPPKKKLKKAW